MTGFVVMRRLGALLFLSSRNLVSVMVTLELIA